MIIEHSHECLDTEKNRCEPPASVSIAIDSSLSLQGSRDKFEFNDSEVEPEHSSASSCSHSQPIPFIISEQTCESDQPSPLSVPFSDLKPIDQENEEDVVET